MDRIVELYLNHIGYYFAIYFLIEVSILINLISIICFCKLKKYKYALLGIIQNILLTMGIILFSICNVVVLDQWVGFEERGLKFSYGDIYVCFIMISVISVIIGITLFMVSYIRYRNSN